MARQINSKGYSVPWAVAFPCLVLALVLITPGQIWADLPDHQPSSRAAALGYGTHALVDGWSVFTNQGAMAMGSGTWVGVHHENLYFSPDLSFSAIGVSLPLGRGVAGVSIKRFGFSEFNQSKGGVAFGLKLTPNLALGVQGNVHHIWAAGVYGDESALTAEGGLIYLPNKNLSIGFHVLNPTRSRIYDDQRIPTMLRLGASYRMGNMLMLVGGVEKGLDTSPMASAGVEFQPSPRMVLRTGFASNPSIACFGVGYLLGRLTMDIAFTYHQRLGTTPHFSISYQIGGARAKTTPAEEP